MAHDRGLNFTLGLWDHIYRGDHYTDGVWDYLPVEPVNEKKFPVSGVTKGESCRPIPKRRSPSCCGFFAASTRFNSACTGNRA